MRIPMSAAGDWELVDGGQDIRGWPVQSATGEPMGRVIELLIDTDLEQIDELILENGSRIYPEDVVLGDGVVSLVPNARVRPGTRGMGVSRVGDRGNRGGGTRMNATQPIFASAPPSGAGPSASASGTATPSGIMPPPVAPWTPPAAPVPSAGPPASAADIAASSGSSPGGGASLAPPGSGAAASGGADLTAPPYLPPRPNQTSSSPTQTAADRGQAAAGQGGSAAPHSSSTPVPAPVATPNDPTQEHRVHTAEVPPAEPLRVPVFREEIHTDVVPREVGAVEIEKRIVEEEHNVDVPVKRDRVQIRRVIVDRPADGTENPYWEGDEYRIPIVSERIEIRRVLRVVEELVLTRDQVSDVEHIREIVRREAVTVRERRDADDPTSPARGVGGAGSRGNDLPPARDTH